MTMRNWIASIVFIVIVLIGAFHYFPHGSYAQCDLTTQMQGGC